MNAIATHSHKLAKHSFLNLLGMTVPSIVGIISIPLAIKGLGTDRFGILSIAWVTLSYLALLDLGISRASTKFTAECVRNGEGGENAIFWTSILLSLAVGIVGAVVLLACAPALVGRVLNIAPEMQKEASGVFRYIAISLPFMLAGFSLKGMLGAVGRFDIANGITIPVNSLNFIFPALAFFSDITLTDVMLLILLTRIGGSVLYFIFCKNVMRVPSRFTRIDSGVMRKLLSYGGWVTVTGVISPLLVYLDRFFIGSTASMHVLTYYAAPLEALTRIRIIPTAIMVTVFPEFSAGLVSGAGDKRIMNIFVKSLKIIMIISGIISILLFSHAHDILGLWLGPEFVMRSTGVFRIFSISIFINFMAFVPFYFLQGIGRPDLPAKFHMVEIILYIALLWMLVQKFGIIGAAFGWVLRVGLDTILLYWGCLRIVPNIKNALRDESLVLLTVLLAVFGCIPAIAGLSDLNAAVRGGISGLAVAALSVVIWRFVLSGDDREWLVSYVNKLPFMKREGV